MKTKFSDLDWKLKVLVIYGYFSIAMNVVWFITGFVMGITGG